ncbi:MAG: VanZ family protein [Akkermansiaceae bacterium]
MITLLLLIAFIGFLAGLTILKTNNISPELFSVLQNVPYHDKLGHLILMGILAYLAVATFSPRLKINNHKHPHLIVGSCVATIIIIEETSQSYFPTRSCSWLDAAAGITGVFIAIFIYKKTAAYRKKPLAS